MTASARAAAESMLFPPHQTHIFKAGGRRRCKDFHIEPFFGKALRGVEHTLVSAYGQKFFDIHHTLSPFASSPVYEPPLGSVIAL